jgi:hypothetical protein
MPLQATSGAASYDGFGGGVVAEPNYIESCFSTWLYTGTGANGLQIQNGIDLAGKGGLVFGKARSGANAGTSDWGWVDTTRGGSSVLYSNTTDAAQSTALVSSFNADGFTLNGAWPLNYYGSPYTYGSWTFRKQPKFFDVVTWTGNGANYRAISHSLGSTPGCVIVKSTSASGAWAVWHQSVDPKNLILNSTSAAITGQFSIQDVGSASFAVANSSFYGFPQSIPVNESGQTYVAYLFAHNAGGFGLTGTDNVISCGSFSGNTTVNLGFEPQWILLKRSSGVERWYIIDNMRGWPVSGDANYLAPNTSDAENQTNQIYPNATGFSTLTGGGDFIYVAIRKGPMAVPTVGTSVFAPILNTGTGSAKTISGVGFAPDLLWDGIRNTSGYGNFLIDKLRGGSQRLGGASTSAEVTESPAVVTQFGNTSVAISASGTVNDSGVTYVNWFFQRAPSFFDEVCWISNDTYPQVLNHNLTVAPELIIRKPRSIADEWVVGFDFQTSSYKKMALNTTAAQTSYGSYSSGELPGKPTATQFTDQGSASGRTFVAYLFATCPAVSKVGSYTGTGTTLQINCGFTGGARFVLIKRTDSTGDWYVWDSARGIVSGNDSYLLLNSTAAEVTNTDYIDTYSAGFEISSTAPAAINASGGSFIFFAVA